MGEIRFVGTGETSGYPYLVCKKKKSQPEGELIMLKAKFTKFPALSVDTRVGIFQSASETDDKILFLLIL